MAYHRNRFNRDALGMVSRDRAVAGALAALTPIQQERPEVMVAAAAVLFAAVADRVQLDAQDLYLLGRKLIRTQFHHDKGNMVVETIRDFAGIQIAGDDNVDYV